MAKKQIDHDQNFKELISTFFIEFLDLFLPNLAKMIDPLKVLEFNFTSIQLNNLNWRDYLNRPNPVAVALMSKMRIEECDRPKVKAECLRLLVTLKLDPAKTRLISKFVDDYLRLNDPEEEIFQAEIATMSIEQKEKIMQTMTSWEEKGLEKGLEKGQRSLVSLQLTQKFGELSKLLTDRIDALSPEQIKKLAIALLGFTAIEDLTAWLEDC